MIVSTNSIKAALDALGANSMKYDQICKAYLTAKLIIAFSPHEKYEESIRSNHALHRVLYVYRQAVSSALVEDCYPIWVSLCTMLRHSGLDQDHEAFFSIYAPNIVMGWDRLTPLFPEIGQMLVALSLILSCPPSNTLTPSSEWLQQTYIARSDMYKKCNLDFKKYQKCWHSIFCYDVPDASHAPNATILHAMSIYHKLYLPMTDLLQNYTSLILSSSDVETKIATRGNRRKARTSTISESGKSMIDTDLEAALLTLSHEKPTDVVRGLFYGSGRNDAGFECSYIMDQFRSMVQKNHKVLIINPSPDLLIEWHRYNIPCEKVSFLVADETIACLYRYEFPGYSFSPFSDTTEQAAIYDCILWLARDLQLATHSRGISLGNPNAKLLCFLPEISLCSDNSPLLHALNSSTYRISKIISIPSQLTESTPRKKVLVYADHHWTQDYFQLLRGLCESHAFLFSTEQSYHLIPYTWLNGNMSIADMLRDSSKLEQNSGTKHPNPPRKYWYSTEIQLSLTIQQNCKNRYAGRLCYRALLRNEDKHRKRGDRLTPIVEKGLRHPSEAEVIAAIEYVALDDRIAQAVVEDILDFYGGRLHEISLKTAWYCLRVRLQTKCSYNENISTELFCGPNQVLSALCIGTSHAEDYDVAMQELFPDTPSILRKYWEQIILILQTATEEGYIRYNPLASHMAVVANRLSAHQQEVRNVLTKKILEEKEEERIMNFLLSCIESKDNERISFRVFIDNRWLAVLIRLLAIPRLREVCALRWADFRQIGELGTYHFQITKYLADDGSLRNSIDRSPELYRYVPIAPALAEILLAYKQQLLEMYGLTSEQLAMYPLILTNHSVLANGKLAKFCSPNSVAAHCKTLIEKVGIAPNKVVLPDRIHGDIVVDLNQYLGDIFYTNLKYHLRHVCGFSDGEIAYFLGLKAPDTYSAHYCDYGHDMLQHRMALKLSRWTAKYASSTQVASQHKYKNYIAVHNITDTFSSSATEQVVVDMDIKPHNPAEDLNGLTIRISSRHGICGAIACFRKEEK